MRILMINDFKTYGGAEVFFKALADELSSGGHEIFVMTREDLPLEWSGFRYISNVDESLQYRWLRRFVTGLAPIDLIHVHNFPLIGLSPFHVAKELEIPAFYTAHDYYIFCPRRILMRDGKQCQDSDCYKCFTERLPARKLRRLPLIKQMSHRYVRKMYERSKKTIRDALEGIKIITVSNRMRDLFKNHDYDSQVILNGLPDKFRGDSSNSSSNGFFLHLARLSWEKGVDLLRELSKQVPILAFNKATLPCFEAIQGSSIDYRGYRPRSEVDHALNLCSAVLSCSVWEEPFGLDVLEAMMWGKPVVATDLGGHQDQVVEGKTGFLVEPDPQSIISACNVLLEDESLARKLGAEGRRRYLKHFTIWRCAENYEKIYAAL